MVLTLTLGAGLVAAIATLGPRVIRSQTERLIPPESAAELSDRILLVLMDQGARPCRGATGERSLGRLVAAIQPPGETPARARVLTHDGPPSARLPDGTILLSGEAIATAGTPDELAGWVATALARDPIPSFVATLGPMDHLRYLVTTELGQSALGAAIDAAFEPPSAAEISDALHRLETADVPTAPFEAALLADAQQTARKEARPPPSKPSIGRP